MEERMGREKWTEDHEDWDKIEKRIMRNTEMKNKEGRDHELRWKIGEDKEENRREMKRNSRRRWSEKDEEDEK